MVWFGSALKKKKGWMLWIKKNLFTREISEIGHKKLKREKTLYMMCNH